MSRTLVTGASGFVGRALVTELVTRGVAVRAPVRERRGADSLPAGTDAPVVGDLTAIKDFSSLLAGVDTVMHLAARAHVTSDRGDANAGLYREVNEHLTRRFAEAALAAKVGRFVFVSTIKVFGETDRGRPYRADDVARPEDVYGRTKLAAELAVREVCAGGGMTPVIVRPPLVYGPGVRANFLRLIRLVDRGAPLPFASVRNRRSMVNLRNLVDFLCRCRETPAAAGRTLLVSDGVDLSTPDLVRHLARSLDRRPRLWPVPPAVLRALAGLLGYGGEVKRLTDSLSLDIAESCAALDWTPPVTVDAGIRSAVAAYRGERSTTEGLK